jgi:3'-phosphoadenosine 5'-phosphosulfate sulfotransferase (PAPS reductase)/FAD synthetase
MRNDDLNLHDYDFIVINSSAGKDSLCAIWEMSRMIEAQDFPSSNVIISHQDLGQMEWEGTKQLAATQARHFGYRIKYSKRRDKDGYEETLLEYVRRRKMWPSNTQRYCTSDFKRGPGARVVTALTKGMKGCRVLHVFGFRSQESPARSKKVKLSVNKMLTTKSREVDDFLPIHDWTTKEVWDTIKDNQLPYHHAYNLGMPRLSCVFCIFSPFDALVVAGKANPELLDEYIAVEDEIGHTFRNGFSLREVRTAIESDLVPEEIDDWIM